MTRDDLNRAYGQCVKLKGRQTAVDAVKAVTGQLFVTDTPDDLIDATVAALTGGTATAQAAPRAKLRVVHDALAGLAASIYGRR